MKKNVLALSITAALVGLGFAGGAQAIGLAQPAGVSPIPPGAAVSLRTSVDGIGHFLYVPYYSAQGVNNTMISVVNTDTVNGKAVKVRFRGAANSDDVFDFQVFLSPSDVWTASVSKNVNGLAQLTTADNSCTKPDKAQLNSTPFQTLRLDKTLTGDALANQTREGYLEIFNMADIHPGTALMTAIKHVKGVPPCTGTAWGALNTDPLDTAAANADGLFAPTTGLFANWIILNVADAGAWSGQATAINAVDAAFNATTGAITYFPQTNEGLGANATTARISLFTADPVLRANPAIAAVYDLPDFSIPYTSSSDPTQQVVLLSAAIATRSISNEWLTDSTINATTDWVLSMPTRRYSVAMNYTTGLPVYTVLPIPYFTPANTTVGARQVCISGITYVNWNREEGTKAPDDLTTIVSPQNPNQPDSFYVCGEASVLSFNNGGSVAASGTLKATVARSAIETGTSIGSVAGWTYLATPGLANVGLPILGYEAVRATATTSAFGANFDHRTSRVQK